MSHQLKVGDRVIAVVSATSSGSFPEWTGVIEYIDGCCCFIKADKGSNWHDDPSYLVLESVYNSPLYKALR